MPRTSSPQKGPLRPWTPTDNTSKVDYALESSLLVVQTLQNIGSIPGVPHLLGEVAGIALSILSIVKDVKNRNQDFMDLASDACGLVYTILIECQHMIKEGQQVPERVQGHLVLLAGNLSGIETFAREKLNRGGLTKIIYHSKDLEQVSRYRALLRNSLDIFGIQSNMSIQETLHRILENIEKQNAELKADRIRQEEEQRRAEEDLASRLEILRIQEKDRVVEEQLKAQREVENDRRRTRERAQERRKTHERAEGQRLEKELERDEKGKQTQRTLSLPDQDLRRNRTARTPNPQPQPNHQFYPMHYGYPSQVPPYSYPVYPPSPYNLVSPVSSPGAISISNVSASGISLGGGPVNVSNWNPGNTNHTIIKDSMNSYAPPRRNSGRRSQDQEDDEA